MHMEIQQLFLLLVLDKLLSTTLRDDAFKIIFVGIFTTFYREFVMMDWINR